MCLAFEPEFPPTISPSCHSRLGHSPQSNHRGWTLTAFGLLLGAHPDLGSHSPGSPLFWRLYERQSASGIRQYRKNWFSWEVVISVALREPFSRKKEISFSEGIYSYQLYAVQFLNADFMLPNINNKVIKYKFSFKVTNGLLKIINTK